MAILFIINFIYSKINNNFLAYVKVSFYICGTNLTININIMTTLREVLQGDESNGNLIILNAVMHLKGALGESEAYYGISGASAPYDWAVHNVDDWYEVENDKYFGLVFNFSNGWDLPTEVKFYIPQWVLNCKVKDYRHAKNLFKKYLRRVWK